MTTRITHARLGLIGDGDRLVLQMGSSTYGYAYRLMLIKSGETGRADLFGGQGFLGMTAREAMLSLDAMRRSFAAVLDIAKAV